MSRDMLRPLDLRPLNAVAVSGTAVGGGFQEATVMATSHLTNHLGATYAVVLLALEDGRVVSQDGRSGSFFGPERPAERKWCPECRKRVELVEASEESTYVGRHEVGYWVERLECGHENQYERGIIGASPGGESAAEAMAEATLRRRQERQTALEERWS